LSGALGFAIQYASFEMAYALFAVALVVAAVLIWFLEWQVPQKTDSFG
jgi:hypothetical protein